MRGWGNAAKVGYKCHRRLALAQSFAESAPDMSRVLQTKMLLLVVVVLLLFCAASSFPGLDANLNAVMDQIPKVNRSIAQVTEAHASALRAARTEKAELFLFSEPQTERGVLQPGGDQDGMWGERSLCVRDHTHGRHCRAHAACFLFRMHFSVESTMFCCTTTFPSGRRRSSWSRTWSSTSLGET